MWRYLFIVVLYVMSSLPSQAQTAPHEHHDHEHHDHEHHNHEHHDHDSHDHAPQKSAGPDKQGENQEEDNVDYFWRKADEAFHAGDYDRAIGLQRAIVALDPGDTESYSVAAWLLWSMGRSDEAVQFIERGLKANPDDWEMWQKAAAQYDLMKRPREAQATYTRALQLIPPDDKYLQMLRRQLAHAAEKAGDFATSVETWRALVKDYPNEQVNKNNLARVEKLLEELKSINKSAALRRHKSAALPNYLLAFSGLLGAVCLPAALSGISTRRS